MTQRNEQLLLSAAIDGPGYHPGAPLRAQHLASLAHYRQLVQTAERGLLDFVLLHDERALPTERLFGRIDALSILARLAPETSHIGLAVSKPTTYSEPFTVSRELATLDFVSGGRAAWNVTTNPSVAEAQRFGADQPLSVEERRSIASEYVEVSRKLWDSWEDDAVVTDRERGWYLDPHKLHHINHVGTHFKIRGPQITYRPPQGHVVVIQAVGDDPAVQPSAAVADVLVLRHSTLDAAQTAYAQHKAEAAALGREVRILQTVLPILGASEAEAQATAAALDAAAGQGDATDQPAVLRLVGTASQVADQLAAWFQAHAADGFHLLPAVLPESLEVIVQDLVPELQGRGLFRTAYEGRTLREHLGLPRPASQYVGAPSEAHTAYEEYV
jgi:alkanesulfonate monooxygenase SsuD/methylene tetrahydromethanopterin reductase-like flavin-dependent oxidoreductase (luciferase family)